MCRLYGFRATDPTRVECSLVLAQNAMRSQSLRDHRGKPNGDGWGIAYYADGRRIVEKRARAAHRDRTFSRLAETVSAETVIAHVRSATVGRSSAVNTHPFTHGPWTFAHNGHVTAFESVGPRLRADLAPEFRTRRRGETDSELVFYWMLSRMGRHGLDPGAAADDPAAVAFLLRDAVAYISGLSDPARTAEPARLNLMLTDGATLAASRWGNTLTWTQRRGVADCAVCGLSHTPAQQNGYRSVVVASEPITTETWHEVPEATVILVDPGLDISFHDLLSRAEAAG